MAEIEVHNLHKEFLYYKKNAGLIGTVKNMFKRETLVKEAVKDVSFQVEKGEMKGLLGPNGAGKTTTLKMLSGILYPTSGSAQVAGYTPWERKNGFKRQFSIIMGQKNQLWWDLPAMDSFYLNKCIYIPHILSFWFVGVNGVVSLSADLWDFGNMPGQLYGKFIDSMGTFVFPIFLITNYPVWFIMGNIDKYRILWAAAAPVLAFVVSQVFWKQALKKYTSASS